MIEELRQRLSANFSIVRRVRRSSFRFSIRLIDFGRSFRFQSADVAGAIDEETNELRQRGCISGGAETFNPLRFAADSLLIISGAADLHFRNARCPAACLFGAAVLWLIGELFRDFEERALGALSSANRGEKLAGSSRGSSVLVPAKVEVGRLGVGQCGLSFVRCRAELEAGIRVFAISGGNIRGELAGKVRIHHGLRVGNQRAERIKRHLRARGNQLVLDGNADCLPRVERPVSSADAFQRG